MGQGMGAPATARGARVNHSYFFPFTLVCCSPWRPFGTLASDIFFHGPPISTLICHPPFMRTVVVPSGEIVALIAMHDVHTKARFVYQDGVSVFVAITVGRCVGRRSFLGYRRLRMSGAFDGRLVTDRSGARCQNKIRRDKHEASCGCHFGVDRPPCPAKGPDIAAQRGCSYDIRSLLLEERTTRHLEYSMQQRRIVR